MGPLKTRTKIYYIIRHRMGGVKGGLTNVKDRQHFFVVNYFILLSYDEVHKLQKYLPWPPGDKLINSVSALKKSIKVDEKYL